MGTDEDTLQKMQEKLAWLEDAVEGCSREIGHLHERVDDIERKIRIIQGILTHANEIASQKEETPPPHY